MSILEKIVTEKREELRLESAATSLFALQEKIKNCPPVRGFCHAIKNPRVKNQPALIAEIKKASPSKGLIRQDFMPAQHAKDYQAGGASCLSVLTNKFFLGNDEHFSQARVATDLPMLRKDFMIDAWQIYQSRVIGADCILLIMAILSPNQAAKLCDIALELELDVLVEVHTAKELQQALSLPEQCMIGINNRNLHNFSTSLETTIDLLVRIDSDRIVISESGLKTAKDIKKVYQAGAKGILVGESLIRNKNIQAATSRLLGSEITF